MTEPLHSPLIRAALIVRNLDVSIGFYRAVLGLEEDFAHGDTRNAAICALLGRPLESRTRFAILKQPGPSFGMVGLFEVSEPPPPALAARTAITASGDIVLVFYHADLAVATAAVRRHGGQVLVPPKALVIAGREGLEAMFADPDGVRINLIQRDPRDALQTTGPGRVL
jgi:catechol 2,3-dioxygenase-like lactoylglutathione lyase family enzyme